MRDGARADDDAIAGERSATICSADDEEVARGLDDVAGVGTEGEERWGAAVGGLGRLKREMAAVVAKMERARVAGDYVLTQRR